MSLANGYRWNYKNVHLIGYSMAGISTSIAFPDADACFDVAQGMPFQMGISNLLITHGHMDHASGLPYVIAQKAMTSQTPPRIYMPQSIVQPLQEIMRIWEKIEDHQYSYEFIPVELDKEYPLKPPYFFKAFPTFHRVPSNGYTVFERKKHLNPKYSGLSQSEIVALRRQGIEIEEITIEPVVSFTGDTKIEFLQAAEWVKRSKVLVMEVTFIDAKKSVENARHWGHIHLDELLPQLESMKNEKIVLIHVSARYSTKQLREILDARVPEHLKTRIEIFPRPV
jgi:ribonuclease Z